MIETKFKQTEIGLIPNDWEVKSIKDATPLQRGFDLPKKEQKKGEYPVVYSNGICSYHDKYMVNGPGVVTGRSGTIGNIHYVISNFWPHNTSLWVTNFNGNYPLFVYYLFQSFDWKQFATGSGVPTLNRNSVHEKMLPFPPTFYEQQRIAEALLNIDKLISSLSKMIEKKRLIKQGAMQQLLTGKKRLLGFDGEWEKHKIGDFLSILKGYGLSKSHLVQDGKNKCILYGELFTRYDYEIKTCISKTGSDEGLLSECGDILMPSSTTTNGIDLAKAVSVYESNIHLGGDIVVLRDKNIFGYEPYFVSAQITELCKHAIEQSSQGITIIHLNTRELRNVEIALPLARKEQMAIANVLRTMDNEIESLEEERDKYIRLKEGMMQKLLTGQIRLIEAETKLIAQPKAKVANVYFKRSVLAAEIADRLCEEKTFGHVKMEKLIFLTEHFCHIDIDSHYHRDAAGPYDNTALRSIDSQMKRHQWFELTKKDKGYRYQPMDKRGEHKKYFDRYFTDILPMFNKVIETFKTSTTEQCEIVATLYSAWDDLLRSGHPFTEDDILNEVLNNWHESKKRIKCSRWQAALDWMRSNGFVPQSENN